jgi:hypothetical protein
MRHKKGKANLQRRLIWQEWRIYHKVFKVVDEKRAVEIEFKWSSIEICKFVTWVGVPLSIFIFILEVITTTEEKMAVEPSCPKFI